MAEFQPNSHKSKREDTSLAETSNEKKVKKVVNGPVKTKKNNQRKLASMFISEDAANVKSYVIWDVLVPSIKKLLFDIGTDSLDMILNGGTRSKERKSGTKVSYRKYYDNPREDRYSDRYNSRSRFDYDDIVFETRREAEDVREEMFNMVERYGIVTVSDMYDMAGLTAPYTSEKYGWTTLRSSEVVRVGHDEYIIKMSKAMPID